MCIFKGGSRGKKTPVKKLLRLPFSTIPEANRKNRRINATAVLGQAFFKRLAESRDGVFGRAPQSVKYSYAYPSTRGEFNNSPVGCF